MKLAISVLSIKDDQEKIKKIDSLDADFIHLDVMDGIFVNNKASFKDANYLTKPLDIHLMVEDIESYIDTYKDLNPDYITFHIEASQNKTNYFIDKIISHNIKVGLSLNPDTDIEKVIPYLSKVDLVLVMSVYPGYGGQEFIKDVIEKINKLKEIKEKENLSYIIEVDGGINNKTVPLCNNADMVVVGSYITDKEDPKESIKNLKN